MPATVLAPPVAKSTEDEREVIARYMNYVDPENEYDGTDTALVASLEAELEEANEPYDPIRRLRLRQQVLDAQDAVGDLEARFIEVVKPFAKKHNFDVAVFQQAGVSDRVLRKAGFTIRRATKVVEEPSDA
jgi:hypothetical protein